MKKNKMKKNKREEKEYRKKRFFAMDDDDNEYEEEGYEEEDDEDEEEDEDDEDDQDEVDDEEEYEEEDIDDEEDGSWDKEGARRARRRARRIRNQILAYLTVIFLVAGVLVGCFFGGRGIIQKFQADRQEKKRQEEQLKALEEAEEEPAVELEGSGENESQSEEEALSPLDEIITAKIAEMPLADKVAALFMVTPEQLTGVESVTKAGDTTKAALAEYKVGGLVYTESNITGADQLKELLANTALIDQTLFLAVNEEGGENSVLASGLSVAEVPDMASVSGIDGARQAGSDTGTYLAEYGFNLNLAPVADVKVLEDSILGNRSFGSDPAQVGEMAAAYISGLTEKGISACVKTFPGLGAVTKSTAEGMADTQRSQADMAGAEFMAYQSAIAAGSEFVMVGTISAPGLTGGDNTPSCLSSAVVGMLRNELGYDGIVITGALNETAVKDYYTSADAAEKALKAGADMIYMPENFKDAYEGLLQAVESGSLEESRIDESLMRIYRVKYKDKVDNVLGTDDSAGDAQEAEEVGVEDAGEEVPAE